jgi:NAD(P)H-dependent FMN reductase
VGNDDARLRFAIIVGSTRSGRFGETVATWFVGQATQIPDIDFDVIDLATIEIPMDFSGGGDSSAFRARIGAADGVIVMTPEYNHSFPGYLKQAIDSVKEEWKTKPVGFVSYGGLSGGLRAVEGLRLVFAELHATTIRDVLSFHQVHGLFDESGQLLNPDGPNATAAYMINELAWWARALKTARATARYPG